MQRLTSAQPRDAHSRETLIKSKFLKGTGFSPYINPAKSTWALAPEGMQTQLKHLIRGSLARGSLASEDARSLRTRSHGAMGTEFTLYLDSADEVRAQACFDAVFDEIDRLESTFSRFRASSEISRLNREAGDGPMVTDPEVFQLLAAALDVSRKTEGVFDITVGQLMRAWGFSGRQPGIPDAQTLAAAQECVGWTNIELDPEWRTVEFLRHGLEVDLGGIAKGYAVDCAMGVLRSAGVQGLIDAGSSSIAATDEAFARGWEVSIAIRWMPRRPFAKLNLGIARSPLLCYGTEFRAGWPYILPFDRSNSFRSGDERASATSAAGYRAGAEFHAGRRPFDGDVSAWVRAGTHRTGAIP